MIDPACAAAVAALERDPFYRCITPEFRSDDAARHAALTRYFDYSIRQGARIGRVVHPEEPEAGVAVWILPQSAEVKAREKLHRGKFLHEALGERGHLNYDQIVGFMSTRAGAIVRSEAWYLSIVAVTPERQGRGLGARLLAPTLGEADAARAVCYLETFNPRSLTFYRRLGFDTRAQFDEPTTGVQYAVMVRMPRPGPLL